MATVTDVHNLARALLGGDPDIAPEVMTDARLLKFSPLVYRDIQGRMSAAGVPELKDYALFDVVAGTVSKTSGDAGFPTTVIKPIRLWEGAQGSVALSSFTQMEEADPELVPRAATAILSHWEWKNKTIYFIGASANRTVRMQFAKFLADLTGIGSDLLIPDSLDAMAYGVAAAAAFSRGSPLFKTLDEGFLASVQNIIDQDAGRNTGT